MIVLFILKPSDDSALKGIAGMNVSNMKQAFAKKKALSVNMLTTFLTISLIANTLIISNLYNSQIKKNSIVNVIEDLEKKEKKNSNKNIKLPIDNDKKSIDSNNIPNN